MKTKSELARALQVRLSEIGLTVTTAKAAEILDVHANLLMDSIVEDGGVALANYAKLVTKDRPARTVRNPQTGKPMDIEASRTMTIKVLTKGKERLN